MAGTDKIPSDEDFDIAGLSAKYADIRRQRDMLKSQNHDMEVSLKVTESKNEKLEAELEQAKVQIETLRNQAVRDESMIKNIASILVDHMAAAKQQQPEMPSAAGWPKSNTGQIMKDIEATLKLDRGRKERDNND